MPQTYELYLHRRQGPPRREAITCATDDDLIRHVQSLVMQAQVRAVEVRQYGIPLFTIRP